MRKEIWYRADYDYVPENFGGGTDEYFCLMLNDGDSMEELDKEAVRIAKEFADAGEDFADAGHVEMELVQIMEVDGEEECFPEIRTVWL